MGKYDKEIIKLAPQPGFQTKFLLSPADVTIGGGCAGCFTGETLICTDKGYKPISEIETGNMVLSVNLNTMQAEFKKVLKTFCYGGGADKQKIRTFILKEKIIIKCTENHEFYIRGHWIKAGDIARGILASCTKQQGKIFNIFLWSFINCWVEGFKSNKNNETGIRWLRLFKNYATHGKKWGISDTYCQNTQDSCTNIHPQSKTIIRGKSQEFYQDRQQSGEPGVGKFKGKLRPFNNKWQGWLSFFKRKSTKRGTEGIENRDIEIDRITSEGNKSKVQPSNLYEKNVSGRIRSCSSDDKRCNFTTLETCDLEWYDFEPFYSSEKVYDLEIEDNHNYCITEKNILVHNSGKSWILLLDAAVPVIERLNNTANYKNYSATIFRRTYPQIENPGGLWDESMTLYPYLRGTAKQSSMEWKFNDPRTMKDFAKIVFRHMQREEDKKNYQGAQLPYIGFDELTHFEKSQFLFMFSRNRSTSGFRAKIRATCNPDPDSFVADMIDWYLNEEGYIDKERDGKFRFFTVDKDIFIWGDSAEEVNEQMDFKWGGIKREERLSLVKSFQFIEGDIYENKVLLDIDPGYLANLLSLPEEDQLRLYKKNWKIKIEKHMIFNQIKFKDIFLNDFVKGGARYITCDIATTGRDLFIIFVWEGKRLIDCDIHNSNNGKEAIEAIDRARTTYRVANSNILFDADGVGAGMTGWIVNCVEFHANRPAVGNKNYKSLKHQLYFELSYCINQTNGKGSNDLYYITPAVAERVFPFTEPQKYRGKTIGWILEHQMRAIRQDRVDTDLRLSVIRKDEQKLLISGLSPDFMDNFMMREYFELFSTERFVSY